MNYEIPEKMKAWVLGNPGELTLEEKPVPLSEMVYPGFSSVTI